MHDIPNEDLKLSNIPTTDDNDSWLSVWKEFALTFDGYAHVGGRDSMETLMAQYEPVVSFFMSNKRLPPELTLSEIRSYLFMAQRLWRGSGEGRLSVDDKAYLKALIEAIRVKVLMKRDDKLQEIIDLIHTIRVKVEIRYDEQFGTVGSEYLSQIHMFLDTASKSQMIIFRDQLTQMKDNELTNLISKVDGLIRTMKDSL